MGCCLTREKEEGFEQKTFDTSHPAREPEAETEPLILGAKLAAEREQSLETATSELEAPAVPTTTEASSKVQDLTSMANISTAATQKSSPDLDEKDGELTDAVSEEAKQDETSSQPTSEEKFDAEDMDEEDEDDVGAELDFAVKQAAEDLKRKEDERLAAEALAQAKAEAEADKAFKGLELSFY